MRSLVKLEVPRVLAENAAAWLAEYAADPGNKIKKYRYREKDIKATLKVETSGKCAYCESKIGHNCPGDVEHKIPSSKDISGHFKWSNLTIACPECNRRKNDYLSNNNPFLDPYTDAVEDFFRHLGPFVAVKNDDNRAKIVIGILEYNTRADLILRKMEKLNDVSMLIDSYKIETDPILKEIKARKIRLLCDNECEYSAMVMDVVKSDSTLNAT